MDRADQTHFTLWIANYYMSMRLRLLGASVAGVTALAVVLRVRFFLPVCVRAFGGIGGARLCVL